MTEAPPNAIAIVGMACRFPGASSIAQFWQNLRDGRESISRFRDDELEDSFPPAVRSRRLGSCARCSLGSGRPIRPR